jgi:DNA-binding transcriptional LysR family regulator
MDTLTSIKVFRQVVESGSFVAAAERLDISTAMVSKHVMHVEERLGVRLLNRNSRSLSLTEPGRVYFERCKTILEDLEETELELGSLGSAPRGTLRISCPSWSPERVAFHLAEYHRRYPDVIVDVSFDDRMVDLVEEGYDVAIRVTSADSLAAGLIARPVRRVNYFIAGSPEYLKRNGVPKSPADLARHDFVVVGNPSTLQLTGPDGKGIEVPLKVVMRYRSAVGVANAVASGSGLAALPAILLEDSSARDRLIPVLTEFPLSHSTLYLVYVSRRYLPLKIRAFRDLFVERISQETTPQVSELTAHPQVAGERTERESAGDSPNHQ